jgi:hypothetical protein
LSNFITTVAGTGARSSEGDGGNASLASFNAPCGMAFDKSENLYVAEDDTRLIRKISKIN